MLVAAMVACGGGSDGPITPEQYTGISGDVDGAVKVVGGGSIPAPIDTGGGGSTPPPPGVGAVQVINNSGDTVFYIYISPSTSPLWGPDQLGTGVLLSGASVTYTDMPPDTYDIRIEFENLAPRETYGFIVAAGLVATFTLNP
jgi:hypothetical protein